MVLIPAPAHLKETGGGFRIGPRCPISLSPACGESELETARLLQGELEHRLPVRAPLTRETANGGGGIRLELAGISKDLGAGDDPGAGEGSYTLEIGENGVTLAGGGDGLFWGAQTLRQILRQTGASLPGLRIDDRPFFPQRGFFHDVTRGKVPRLETLFELVDRLAFYKINQLQLYVEHTFAFRGLSEAWCGKDPLTASDILELDAYCRRRHVELVPALATFGHLYEILSTRSFSALSELDSAGRGPFGWYDRMQHHTLDVSNPASFELVRAMLDEYMPLFSSKRFNICCDETFDLGRGKNAQALREKGAGRLYVDFLRKVAGYVQSKGRKVLFWGDIILKHPEYLSELPENSECLFWDYSPDVKEDGVRTLAQAGLPFQVCCGVCGWNRLMNLFSDAYENTARLAAYGKKYGACGMITTDWGDFGHINLLGSSIPGMIVGAGFSWNPGDARGFEAFCGDVSLLEYGNRRLVPLLAELSLQQAGTWGSLVAWHEAQFLKNPDARRDAAALRALDEEKALGGFRRALELEKQIVEAGFEARKPLDAREFVVAAHGAALFDAACLALKKASFGGREQAMEPSRLAAELELWFSDYTDVWRARNRESELFRIRDTLAALCAFLRAQAA